MSRWFRHYAGMMRDEKLVSAAVKAKQPVERVVWVWGALLESAAEINDGGRYEFDCGEAAYFLRCDEDELVNILGALETLGRLHGRSICKWADRQYESDNSTERVRKHRARVTSDDSTVSNEVGNNGRNNNETLHPVRVTPPETETETEKKDISRKKNRVEEITDHFERWYQSYPLHKGRGAALRAYRAAILKTEIDYLLDVSRAFAKKCAGMDAKFIPHPATWLNQERWLDEDLQPPKPQEPVSNGLVYINYGTDPGDAWERDYRSRGKVPPQDGNGGYYFPSEWPPPRETPTPSPQEEAA